MSVLVPWSCGVMVHGFWKRWSGTCVFHRSSKLSRGQDFRQSIHGQANTCYSSTQRRIEFKTAVVNAGRHTLDLLKCNGAGGKPKKTKAGEDWRLLVIAKLTSVSQRISCITSLIPGLDKFSMLRIYKYGLGSTWWVPVIHLWSLEEKSIRISCHSVLLFVRQ